MSKLILNLLINTISVFVTAQLLTGVQVNSWQTALIVAIVLGVINTMVKPILTILSLPLIVATLGIFYLVLNALFSQLASWLVPGFAVDNWLSAILFGLVLSIINFFLHKLAK